MVMQAESDRFKKIIRDSFYPALQPAGSMKDAQTLCEILKAVINGAMNKHWEGKTVKDLDLITMLNEDAEAQDREIYTALITSIEELSIGDAQKLIQGMGGALDGYARRIAEGKQMADVPVEEIITG